MTELKYYLYIFSKGLFVFTESSFVNIIKSQIRIETDYSVV